MGTFKAIVDTLCQPKVLAIIGVVTLIVGSFMNNNNAIETGLTIIVVAGFWGLVT